VQAKYPPENVEGVIGVGLDQSAGEHKVFASAVAASARHDLTAQEYADINAKVKKLGLSNDYREFLISAYKTISMAREIPRLPTATISSRQR